MKFIKNITLFVLPVMLLLMLLRLNSGNDPYISLKYLTDIFAAWDPLEPFRYFGNYLQNAFDELLDIISNVDSGYFESIVDSVALIAKTFVIFINIIILGPLKELLDLILLLIRLLGGVVAMPGIETPFDKGYLI